MKSSATAIPAPGQVVKYQPPLMRFLRGSKSTRIRSRAIPLFTRRKRAAIDAAHHHQEPSSPKVTCIGQVRIRRSSSKSKQLGPPPPLKRRTSSSNSAAGNWFCFWVGKPPSICCSFRFSRRKSSCFRPLWRKWVSFFCCRTAPVPSDSPRKDSVPTVSCMIYTETDSDSFDLNENRGEEYLEEEEEEETEENISGRVPPINALVLTRCRSAPQRSSYLASQFWGSPSKTEDEAKTGEQDNRVNTAEEAAAESRIDGEGEGNLVISEQEASKTEEEAETKTMKIQIALKACADEKQREKEGGEGEEERIVVLTRCKSEPARRSGDPLSSSFWRERKMESTVSCRNSVET